MHAVSADASDSSNNIPLSVLKNSTNSVSAKESMDIIHSVASTSTNSAFQQFVVEITIKKK